MDYFTDFKFKFSKIIDVCCSYGFIGVVLGILTMIIVRTLRRDIAKYNKMDEEVINIFI